MDKEISLDENKKFIFNPYYRMHNDEKRVVFASIETPKFPSHIADSDIVGFIHPIHAMLFSFFTGATPLHKTIGEIAYFFDISRETAIEKIKPFINNERIFIQYDGLSYSFPKNIIIENNKNYRNQNYSPADFNIKNADMDFSYQRLIKSPLDLNFIVNNTCVTDCIYCYCDKSRHVDCTIPLNRLQEIIKEASALNMRSFDISGGELFLYKEWQEFIYSLKNNGFDPYISSKIPINIENVNKLSEINVRHIQISLDSVNPTELCHTLKVDSNYFSKIESTIENLEKKGIYVTLKSILTSYTYGKEGILKLYEFAAKHKNIIELNIGFAGYSLYKTPEDFKSYRVRLKDIQDTEKLIEDLQIKSNGLQVVPDSSYVNRDEYFCDKDTKMKNFNGRSFCTGNTTGILLLPDGKVSICEELYWHPKFIIGDLMEQSITDVWHSEKAKRLFEIQPEDISENSACKHCKDFHDCRQGLGVCWKEVLISYGKDNWDYPDPRCPYAPEVKYISFVE